MRGIVLVAVSFLAAGCGEQSAGQTAASGGGEPTTAASLAFVAAEHAGQPDSASEGSNLGEAFLGEPLEAELRFGSTGEYDGDAVQVVVGGRLREDISSCDQLGDRASGCQDLDDGFWYWGEEEPEEDPGGVFVVLEKAEATVMVAYYGPVIQGDPREQQLPIDVETLIDLAADPRVDLTTTQEAVEGGEAASYWRG